MPMSPKGKIELPKQSDFDKLVEQNNRDKDKPKNLLDAPREDIHWEDGPANALRTISVARERVGRFPVKPIVEKKPPEPKPEKNRYLGPRRMPKRNDQYRETRDAVLTYHKEHPEESPAQIAKALELEGPYVRTVLLRVKGRTPQERALPRPTIFDI